MEDRFKIRIWQGRKRIMKYIFAIITLFAFYFLGLILLVLLVDNGFAKHSFYTMFFVGMLWRGFADKYIFKDKNEV